MKRTHRIPHTLPRRAFRTPSGESSLFVLYCMVAAVRFLRTVRIFEGQPGGPFCDLRSLQVRRRARSLLAGGAPAAGPFPERNGSSRQNKKSQRGVADLKPSSTRS
jgi:hypothetical protein